MTLYEQLAKITYSSDCYISGMRALNIADFENHTGDWHCTVFWNPNALAKNTDILGKDSPTMPCDTNYYFGDDGIFLANEVLAEMGVPKFSDKIFAASHARAIADLVVYCSLQRLNPFHVIDAYALDDFMELDSDKQKVYILLDKALHKLKSTAQQTTANWLNQVQSIEYE